MEETNIVKEEPKSKRGRKKKEVIESDEPPVEKEKKKRGRKKKWEVETSHKLITDEKIVFNQDTHKETPDIDSKIYDRENVSFGNLKITVHTNKDTLNIDKIKDTLKNSNTTNNKCKINLTNSDNESDSEIVEIQNKKSIMSIIQNEKKIKVLKFYKDTFDSGNEILSSTCRCYNCHHHFPNKPFFLPIEYCDKQKKYKVMGNFCSPNCVKCFAINSKIYSTKAYLVGEMYRKLFGYSFRIIPAPPIQTLIEYGGKLTIDEYRQSFFNDNMYSLQSINCKVVIEEIVEKTRPRKFKF